MESRDKRKMGRDFGFGSLALTGTATANGNQMGRARQEHSVDKMNENQGTEGADWRQTGASATCGLHHVPPEPGNSIQAICIYTCILQWRRGTWLDSH